MGIGLSASKFALLSSAFVVSGVLAALPSGSVEGAGEGGSYTLLIVYITLALVVSFTCSILEATLLSARVGELEERQSAGDAGAAKLLTLKREKLDQAISSILILNTLAHTFGVAGAGIEAQKVWPADSWMLKSFPIVLTLLILILTEIIPKTLGAAHASRLVGIVARITGLLVVSMKPVLFLTNLITRALSGSGEAHPVSRGELAAMVAMAARQGTLPGSESRLMENVLRIHQIQVEDVMSPRTVLAMLPHTATVRDLIDDPAVRPYSRVPMFRETRDEVLGYVIQRDVVGAAARGLDPATPLDQFLRPLPTLPESTPADAALRELIDQSEHMALVVGPYGGTSGLVTLEDLIETLLGVEILDETDRVADLREEAVALREKRRANLEAAHLEAASARPAGSSASDPSRGTPRPDDS